jgi:hypothetical protein
VEPPEAINAPRMWMYLDGDDRVQHIGISGFGIDPQEDAWLRLMGIYDQLPDSDRDGYEQLLAASRQYPDRWNRWEDPIARDGNPFYIG